MRPKIDLSLYLVTDRDLMTTPTLEEAVEEAISGGVTLVQLREKKASSRDFYELAVRIKAVTDRHEIPLIVNDRADIALGAHAAGVHVGQSDIPAKVAREIMGDDKIVGVSVSNAQEAIKAQEDGADYLGVGPMFSTDTKKDAEPVSFEEFLRIREFVHIPIVVIGGINENTIVSWNPVGIGRG
ncbi:MAG TPA: thiamine phosphate synthase, partial [Bacillota bacterium]|nr:thiamine phosphate synthase [Bacillota bacterium]